MVGSDTMRLNIPTVTTVTTGLLWNTDNDLTTGEYAIGNGEDFPYEPAGRFDFSFNSKTLSATSFNSDCWDGAIDVTYYNWYYMAGTFSFDDDGVNVTNGYSHSKCNDMEKNNAVFMIAVCALAMSIVVGCAETNAPTSYTTTPTPKPAPDTSDPPAPAEFLSWGFAFRDDQWEGVVSHVISTLYDGLVERL